MALIKTPEEVQTHVTVSKQLSMASLGPHIRRAEKTYIRKYLGIAQYDELHVAYNSQVGLTPALTYLLEEAQAALAFIAVASWMNIGRVTMDDTGVKTDKDAAHGYTIAEIRKDLFDGGMNALESMLAFLEESKASYPLWVNSTAYTQFKQYFINSASEFNQVVKIGESRSTFLSLVPIMRKVEQLSIEPAISTGLMAELKSEIASASLTADNMALLPYIQDAVAYQTILDALQTNSYELVDDMIRLNLFMLDGTGSKQLASNATAALQTKMEKAREDSQAYLERLVNFLNSNASAVKYAAYYNSSAYTPPVGGSITSLNKVGSPTYSAL